jgi:uncharacterized protein YprB with RNaseH-like and TPR domain
MTDLASRLREIVRGPGPATRPGSGQAERPLSGSLRELTYEPEGPAASAPADLDALCASLGGVPFDAGAGRCLRISRRYEADRWHGDLRIGDCELTDLAALDVLFPGTSGTSGTSGTPVFLDIETTGLSGGAGTIAFLVGCGFFDLGAFQVYQFLLTSFATERALLAAVAASVESGDCLVTYNGKSFDLPVMETRWLFHRLPAPLSEKPHVDMLHPARRLWKRRESEHARGGALRTASDGCNLAILERDLFGVRRVGDVPGFEIPSRYFRFLRTGNPAPLEAVLEHNRLDLVSLAAVTARAAAIARGGSTACRDNRERVALGRMLERAGLTASAEQCYADASEDPDPDVGAEAWCRLALLLRRARRYADAADAWHKVLAAGTQGNLALGKIARVALAVHMEHRTRDLDSARALALEALLDLEETDDCPRARDGLRHRLARLDRKIGRTACNTVPITEPEDEGYFLT